MEKVRLVDLARGEIEGSLRARVVGKLRDKLPVRGLGVSEALGLELGLAECVLRSGRFGVESGSLAEPGDGGIGLFQADVGVADA